jgi:hypothetical protein
MVDGGEKLAGEDWQRRQQFIAAFLDLLPDPFHADRWAGAKQQLARLGCLESIRPGLAAGKVFIFRQTRPPATGFLQQGRSDTDIENRLAAHLFSPARSASRLPKA